MATQNLLRGEYRGSVGRTTGQKWKGRVTVHARIFSKAPPTPAQTNCLVSFGCIQRIASALRKTKRTAFILDTAHMTAQNALCSILKDAESKDGWSADRLAEVFKQRLAFEVSELSLNQEAQTAEFRTVFSGSRGDYSNLTLFAMLMSDKARVYMCKLVTQDEQIFKLTFPIGESTAIQACTMAVWHKNGKNVLGGWSIKSEPVSQS